MTYYLRVKNISIRIDATDFLEACKLAELDPHKTEVIKVEVQK